MAALLPACTAPTQPPTKPPRFHQQQAYSRLVQLCDLGPRNNGSEGKRAAEELIQRVLREAGAEVSVHEFEHTVEGSPDPAKFKNIIGRIRPRDEGRVLIGTHYDTRSTADKDPDAQKRNEPIVGANDGASGVAVLLEMAMAWRSEPPPVGVDLIFFDGEDFGQGTQFQNYFLGSKAWMRDHPDYKPMWGVILDMVGDSSLRITKEKDSSALAPHVVERIWNAAARVDSRSFVKAAGSRIQDDHIAFLQKQIPVALLIDFDYPWFHTTADTPDKCSAASLGEVGRAVMEAVEAPQASCGRTVVYSGERLLTHTKQHQLSFVKFSVIRGSPLFSCMFHKTFHKIDTTFLVPGFVFWRSLPQNDLMTLRLKFLRLVRRSATSGHALALLIFCVVTLGCKSSPDQPVTTPPKNTVAGYEVVNVYPHDPGAYTQGLEFHDGKVLESTGEEGRSSLRVVDLPTGNVIKRITVPRPYFAEGLTLLNGKIYQLTWQHQKGFIYDANSFEKIGEFKYYGEGWGLTHANGQLVISDGSNRLRFLDPETFQVKKTISVLDNGSPIQQLNELEYVNGEIWSNVWHEDRIARINPENGQVVGWIDLKGLLAPNEVSDPEAVLNGIAYDEQNKRLFVTGKLWPKLFEIRIKEQ